MATRFRQGGTLTARLLDHYLAAPDRAAITLLQPRQPDQSLSYRRLLHGAAGYARAYQAAGVQPGEVVVLILPHGEALVCAFWGALLAGAAPSMMPFLTEKLAPEKYRQELAALVAITRPAALVTYPEFAAEAHAALAAGVASGAASGVASGAHGGAPTSVRSVITADRVTVESELDLASLPGLRQTPDDLALLQHSSGTTGLQKGVALSHRAVLRQLDVYADAIRLSEDDVIVSWLPLYHDMGLIAGFVMPVALGVPLVLMSPFDWVRAPYRLLQAISQYRGTLSWLPNFAFNFCAQKIRDRDLQGVDLSTWRAVINCSEPTRLESHERFVQRFAALGLRPQAPVTCYAMAENVFAVTQSGFDGPQTIDPVDRRALISEKIARPAAASGPPSAVVRLLSAGRPLANMRVRVLDDQRRDLPERQLGEIALHSDCMLSGYYNRPDLTEQAFFEGFYLTGDLGYVADGELYVTGRKKDLIIVGGKNVHPQDLETLAAEVPGVHPGRVVAFGVFDDDAGTEDVVVVAEADTYEETERQAIGDAVRLRINQGSDVAVRRVHVVGPRWVLKTSSGKLARAANRDKYLDEMS